MTDLCTPITANRFGCPERHGYVGGWGVGGTCRAAVTLVDGRVERCQRPASDGVHLRVEPMPLGRWAMREGGYGR